MKFFIDTAHVEDIKKANDMGVIYGVTTNCNRSLRRDRADDKASADGSGNRKVPGGLQSSLRLERQSEHVLRR